MTSDYGPGANPLTGPVSGVVGFTPTERRRKGYSGNGKRIHTWLQGEPETPWYPLCGMAEQEIVPTDQPVTCRVCLRILAKG